MSILKKIKDAMSPPVPEECREESYKAVLKNLDIFVQGIVRIEIPDGGVWGREDYAGTVYCHRRSDNHQRITGIPLCTKQD
ncbi:hypothetical protein PGO03_09830 [Klebsiella aerogenes]|uniref:hypothetical protein n=1 Tax=Klebsiella aerogenes TaxID=548 RepID=UPI000B2E1E5E|nr:hypothetical protein [Klebsiella aerogenes]MDK6931720.1 hypothetical protein [Klebsiella aerogenes]